MNTHTHSTRQVLTQSVLIVLGFMILEALVGWYTHSLALLSDAVHMLTDAGGLVLALVAHWIAHRPRTDKHTYGYYRAEALGALGNGLLIWCFSGFLIASAIGRLYTPVEVQAPLAMVTAVLGLLCNLWILRVLHPEHHHDHDQNEDHGHPQETSFSVRAARLHVLGDLLGSIGAVTAMALIWWKGWNLADPVFTLLSCTIILWSSFALIRDATRVLMEMPPERLPVSEVRAALESLPHVKAVHELHLWSISADRPSLSVHLDLSCDSASAETILDARRHLLTELEQVMTQQFKIPHYTVQIDLPGDPAQSGCDPC